MTDQLVKEAEKLVKYTVRFFNPETHLLHSAVTILAANGPAAVKGAIDHVQTTYKGAELDALPAYVASVVDENGQGVPGLEKQLSKAQIGARIAELQKHLDALDDDGQTPAQVAAVAATVPGVQQVVNAPPAVNAEMPAETGPTPPLSGPVSVEVDPADAPMATASPAFTQSDIDSAVSSALTRAEAARQQS